MTFEEPEPDPPSDHISEWIGESFPYFPTFLFDESYNPEDDFDGDSFWAHTQNLEQELVNTSSYTTTMATETTDSVVSNQSSILDLPKKRKLPDESSHKAKRKNTPDQLNPCAAAITARNPSRVQHFLYVLHDLASLTGDANHRLAFHGLRALTHYLSSGTASTGANGNTFASSNPKFFRDSLIKFNDINPWFRIPNNVANSSILQILNEQRGQKRNLHIVDIGVSHGVQWPTLLEELTRRTGGPPPLVRLTVVYPPENTTPFAIGPATYDFSGKLLSFAKDLKINLQINKIDSFQLQNLCPQIIDSSADETLIICAQFRLHNLNHTAPDDRSQFLKSLRSLQPEGLILSENNTDCSCVNCGDFTAGFSRKVEYLWRFLDSTSVAYKGRESEDRRMMEAEAAKVMVNMAVMNERKEKWCERMRGAGFKREVFGDDTIDGARALLRKYDSNWEIRVDEKDGCVGLWWKGQTVSFCSLWKMDSKD